MIYAVGDVHGEAQALRELLAKLPLTRSDLVVFLGDLINRCGPDPFDCIAQVVAFDRCAKICLLGNHEEALRDYLEVGDIEVLDGMESETTFRSYEAHGYPIAAGDPASIPDEHARYLFQAEPWTLPFYITDTHIFTHAGWDLRKRLEGQSDHAMRWGRVSGFEQPIWDQTVVRGHTPLPKVTFARSKRTIGVDTGAGMGGRLSAVAIPNETIYSAHPIDFDPKWYFAPASRKSIKF